MYIHIYLRDLWDHIFFSVGMIHFAIGRIRSLCGLLDVRFSLSCARCQGHDGTRTTDKVLPCPACLSISPRTAESPPRALDSVWLAGFVR